MTRERLRQLLGQKLKEKPFELLQLNGQLMGALVGDWVHIMHKELRKLEAQTNLN